MHPQEIAGKVAALPLPTSPDRYPLEPMADNIYLSRSSTGEPCVVLTYSPGTRLPTGRQTEGLLLTFHEKFAATLGGETQFMCCGVLQCLSPELHQYFYLMVSGLLARAAATTGSMLLPSALLKYVEEWQQLLLNRRSYTAEEEIGLWGELQLILACADTAGAVDAWQGPLRKRHDFAANGIDIDVKTSLRGHLHHFRLEQLSPSPSGSRRFVFSIRAVDDPSGGTTVDDLVVLVRERLQDPGPFERLLLEVQYYEGVQRSMRLTALEMRLIRVEDVPSVTHAPGVSQVEFVSDLSTCAPLAQAEAETILATITKKVGA